MEEPVWGAIEQALRDNPKEVRRFRLLISNIESSTLDKWLATVDESDYSLKDWVDAILAFEQWLNDQGIAEKSFLNMLGYLQCCAEMLSDHVEKPCLEQFLLQCLSDFGYEPE